MFDKQKEKLHDRRSFLTKPFKSLRSPQAVEVELERSGNVATIVKPEGTFTFIYNNAYFPKDYSDQLPSEIDGLVLETGVNPWMDDPLRYVHEHQANRGYFRLFRTIQEMKVPLVFADFWYKNKGFGTEYIPAVLEALGILGETKIGIDLLKKISREKKDRRDILKIGARSIAAAWLVQPALSYFSALGANAIGEGEESTTELVKLSNKTHPEVFLLTTTLRNVVIAHKEEWLASKKGNKPHFATIIGVGHAGIEDQIQYSPEERWEFLRRLKPLLQMLVRPEEFYRIGEFEYTDNMWKVNEVHEVPELKKLVAK